MRHFLSQWVFCCKILNLVQMMKYASKKLKASCIMDFSLFWLFTRLLMDMTHKSIRWIWLRGCYLELNRVLNLDVPVWIFIIVCYICCLRESLWYKALIVRLPDAVDKHDHLNFPKADIWATKILIWTQRDSSYNCIAANKYVCIFLRI